MPYVRTKLNTVETPLPDAFVIQCKPPAFVGNENEDLLCGGCGIILGKSVSSITIKTSLGAPSQVVLLCPKCDTKNVLPSTMTGSRKPG